MDIKLLRAKSLLRDALIELVLHGPLDRLEPISIEVDTDTRTLTLKYENFPIILDDEEER